MALTSDQLSDLQGDLAISDDESVFTDAQLERLYVRAGEDYNTAVYMALRQLLVASTKWIDYQVAQTKESRSQVFDHLKKMVDFWQVEAQKSTNTQGVKIVGMTEIPPRTKEEPVEADSERRKQLRRSTWR